MKVFVSTTTTQGQRDNDFCFVPEDELLTFSFECTSDGDDPDANCGCQRSLVGLTCHVGTTTMKVAEFDGNVYDLAKLIYANHVEGGWLKRYSKTDLHYICDAWAGWVAKYADTFDVGAIVERRGVNLFVQRMMETA